MREQIVEFLDYCQGKGYSKGTIGQYWGILSRFLAYFGEERELDDFSLHEMVLYREHLASVGYAVNTRNNHITALKSFFNWYWEMNELPERRSPTRALELIEDEERSLEYLSPDLIEEMRCNCRNLYESAIFELLFTTGIRAGELLSADVFSYSSQRKELRVLGKGNVERIVPLTDRVTEILDQYLNNREEEGDALFISTKTQRRTTYNQLYYLIRKLSKGLARTDLVRNTMAQISLEGGMTLKDVQDLLGHKNIHSTSKYAQVTRDVRQIHETIFVDTGST